MQVLGCARPGPARRVRRRGPVSSSRCPRSLTSRTSGSAGRSASRRRGAAVFWVSRDTELNWDFVFVEAHTVGQDDWTTLPDSNGHTSQDTGFVCPFWFGLHPFLEHYQTPAGDGMRSRAARPASGGRQPGPATATSSGRSTCPRTRAATSRCRSATRATTSSSSNGRVRRRRRRLDRRGHDVVRGRRQHLDGWTVPGAPEGSAPNPNDWIVGTVERRAHHRSGEVAERSLARQPEIIDFLEGYFGRTRSRRQAASSTTSTSSASRSRRRPGRSTPVVLQRLDHPATASSCTSSPTSGSVTTSPSSNGSTSGSTRVSRRMPNGCGASRRVSAPAQEIFDFYAAIPADDPFWDVTIGDPGPD